MSLKYRNASGVETPVAGLNGTSGELVPSNSLLQSGSIRATVEANGITTIAITFTEPMPDTDYVVEIAFAYDFILWGIRNKTVNGFEIKAQRDGGALTDQAVGTWQAFKLITDEAREADEAAIQQNATDIATINSKIPSDASSSNKLVSASDVRPLDSWTPRSNIDANTLTSTGLYYLTEGCTNVPNTYVLISVQSKKDPASTTDLVQTATRISDGSVYVRVRNSDIWSPWKQLATTDSCVSSKNISSNTSGDVINIPVLKQYLLDNIANYGSIEVVDFNSTGQHGTFFISKTSDTLFSAIYVTGYLSNPYYFQYINEWAVSGQMLTVNDLTSIVAANSNAPVTSGGVYENCYNKVFEVALSTASTSSATYTLDTGHYEVNVYYYGGLAGKYALTMNQFGSSNGGRINTLWENQTFQNYVIAIAQATGVVSMTATGADHVNFVISRLP